MRWLATLIGLLIASLGIVGIVVPAVLLNVASFVLTPTGLYGAAAFRIVSGFILIGAASASRLPRTLRVLGIIVIIAGIVTPFWGLERAHAMVDYWVAQGPLVLRGTATFALILGLFIVYAVTPRRTR